MCSKAMTFLYRSPGGLIVLVFSIGLWLATGAAATAQEQSLSRLLDEAGHTPSLETVIVAHQGEMVAERGYNGHKTDEPTNIKSASKTVISALVGMAIERKLLTATDQPIAGLLRDKLPKDADPRLESVTIGNLLSMQAGLGPTSGAVYGRWIASRDWVRTALEQPFADDPGGGMLYSTGSTHLLSAILTRVAGRSTLAAAREWFAPLEGFSIASWSKDPQGIYLGGNEMAMTPRSLLAFGELYRRGGVTAEGKRLLSSEWIEQSWVPRTRSIYTGDGYGYGWFLKAVDGEAVHYAWGYGGQMLYVVPSLGLTVVMTSDDAPRPTTIADRDRLNALLAGIVAHFKAGPDQNGR